MVQLMTAVLVSSLAGLAYSSFCRYIAAIHQDKRDKKDTRPTELEEDPVTGVYKPKK
ncbi:hypothetical protein [Candidatus Endowatersipora endosymbiont of Watersipora subatra]|uniref:hypothetical protein n=1 Tax=Candidatus Endowatersipora endosymbiont of Watersipora subatra TaxID=3077946 RepID=UPI00312C7B81